jgi:hypothetical protein
MQNRTLLPCLLLAGLVAFSTGCNEDEFLMRTPPNRYTPNNFFETEDQIRDATIGLYPLARGLYTGAIFQYGELRSDNTTFEFNRLDRGRSATEEIDYFLMNPNNGLHANIYDPLYTGIARANYIIDRIGDVPFEDETLKLEREAEAYFFRGFYHYLLTLHFGPVVPRLDPLRDDGESLIGLERQPIEEVYTLSVIPDLTFAIDNLPEEWEDDQQGRVTRGAAQMALAKAYFARRNFADALPILNDLVASGTYRLLDDFEDVFFTDNNDEIIYAGQFDAGAGQGSEFMFDWVPRSGDDISQDKDRANTGFNIPTCSLIEAFEEGDERFEATIGFYDSDPADATNEIIPYSRKFLPIPFPQAGGVDVDFPIFRYADALLMQAEALIEVEGGLPNQAFENINRLRARAGLPFFFPGNPDPALDIQTTEDLRAAVKQERRVELAYEASRTYDLRRYGTFVETMLAHGEVQKEKQSEFLDELPEAYTNIRQLLAIPPQEVLLYGYEQNPGWE